MNNNKIKITFILVFILLFVSIGYAYLSANLDVLGIANVKKVKWHIYLESIDVISGKEFEVVSPKVNETNTTSINYKVTLENPGDVYSFKVDVVNDGTIDAMISLINSSNLSDEQKKFTRYSITYEDGTPIQEKNFLGSYSKDTFLVTVEFRQDIDIADLPSSDNELNLSLNLEYVQAKDSDNKTNKSTLIKDLSGNGNNAIMYGGVRNDDGTVTTDGVDDYIDCGFVDFDFSNTITYIIRAKFIAFRGNASMLIGNWEQSGGGMFVKNGKLTADFYINNSYNYYYTNFRPNTGEWYTFVTTYDGEKIKIYANGESLSQESNPNSYELSITGSIKSSWVPVYLGANPLYLDKISDNNANFTISDALIFDRSLSEEEIARDYGEVVNPTDYTDMLAYYKFLN